MAEREGFEPPRRYYRPTGIRSQTLQPLGYLSTAMVIITYRPAHFQENKSFACTSVCANLFQFFRNSSEGYVIIALSIYRGANSAEMQDQSSNTLNRITNGIIWKEMLIFFFPLAVGSFVQQLYNTADAVIIGRFVGKAALAAVGGPAMTLTYIVITFFNGLFAGVTVIIAQRYGADDSSGLHRALHTAYAFGIAASIAVTAAGLLSSPALLRWMGTPDEIMGPSLTYLKIWFGGVSATILYNLGSSVMRAVGDSRRPLLYLVICSVLNILLDIIFVVVLHKGIPGAAAATVISQAVSAVLVTGSLMRSYDSMHLRLTGIAFDRRMLSSQLRIGFPGSLQALTYGLTNIIIQAGINSFGTDTIAAWAAYGKLDVVYWVFCSALTITATTFCGQNYGAGRTDRIFRCVRTILLISMVTSIIVIGLFCGFARPLLSLFLRDSKVIGIGVHMIYFLVPTYIICSLIEILSGCLRGFGDVKWPTVFTLGGILLVRTPWLLLLLPRMHTIQIVLMSYPVSWISTAVLLIPYYFMRKKQITGSGY